MSRADRIVRRRLDGCRERKLTVLVKDVASEVALPKPISKTPYPQGAWWARKQAELVERKKEP